MSGMMSNSLNSSAPSNLSMLAYTNNNYSFPAQNQAQPQPQLFPPQTIQQPQQQPQQFAGYDMSRIGNMPAKPAGATQYQPPNLNVAGGALYPGVGAAPGYGPGIYPTAGMGMQGAQPYLGQQQQQLFPSSSGGAGSQTNVKSNVSSAFDFLN
jgi:hypothetical protein